MTEFTYYPFCSRTLSTGLWVWIWTRTGRLIWTNSKNGTKWGVQIQKQPRFVQRFEFLLMWKENKLSTCILPLSSSKSFLNLTTKRQNCIKIVIWKVFQLLVFLCVRCGTLNTNQSKEFECVMEFPLIHFNAPQYWYPRQHIFSSFRDLYFSKYSSH